MTDVVSRDRGESLPVIRVTISPEVIELGESATVEAQFFAWVSDRNGRRNLVEMNELVQAVPTLELLHTPTAQPLDTHVSVEWRIETRGHYITKLRPPEPGTWSYLLKPAPDAASGQLIEIQVVDPESHERAVSFFDLLLQRIFPR